MTLCVGVCVCVCVSGGGGGAKGEGIVGTGCWEREEEQ